MSSILDDIENTLQYGDVEMLRKEIDEKLNTLEDQLICSVSTKADLSYTEILENKIHQLTCENKELYIELKNLYEKLSSLMCLMIELTDNSPVVYQRCETLKDCANELMTNFSISAYKISSHTY